MTVGMSELPPEGMQLGGVALAGDVERGTRTTEGLSLLFTTAGITVQGPQPQIERLLVWSGLDSASCGEKIVLPDGRDAAVMELTSGGQSIRFLLPTDAVTPGQAAYLDQALPSWLHRYKGSASGDPRPGAAAFPPGATMEPGTPPPSDQMAESGPETGPDLSSAPETVAASGLAAAGASAGAFGANREPDSNRAPGVGLSSPPDPGPPGSAPPSSVEAPLDPQPSVPPQTSSPTPPPRLSPSVSPPPAPPPPPASPGRPSAEAPAPPPPPQSPAGAAPSGPPPVEGTAGYILAHQPERSPMGDSPPPGATASEGLVQTKKTRGWRRARPPAGSGPVPPPGVLAPQPPPRPPDNPVPLRSATLPPPPADSAQAPMTTAQPGSGANASPPPPPPPPASGGWRGRRTARTDATTELGTGGAVGAAGAAAAWTSDATGVREGPGIASSPGAPGMATPGTVAPDGPVTIPSQTHPPEWSPTEPAAARRWNKRPVVVGLLLVLIAILGAIVFFAVRKNPSMTATTLPNLTNPSTVATDTALAASINLHLSDLPSGWTPVSPAARAVRPPAAPAAAQVQANRSLAACIGLPYATAAGLFGGSALPGQTSSVRSPTFASGADPNFQMYSATTILSTQAQLQALAAPFANPSFAACYQQYQTSLVAAAVPGASAQIEVVTLTAPAGVRSFGYLTTFTLPNQGTEVVGQAFMLGGRIESRLQPSTNGGPVPSADFNPAYNGMVGRIGRALNN